MMHYRLTYSGAPGNVSAFLLFDGVTVDATEGLSDRKAAEKWGDAAARDHKVDNTPPATQQHNVILSGSKTFSL
jgi:hypothetical protein